MVVSQDTKKGLLTPIPYGRSTGANTLTPDGYPTRFMVLQGNPAPLTPGCTSVPGHQVTILTATIVTYVL